MACYLQRRIQNPVEYLRWSFCEIVNGLKPWTVFPRKLILDVWQSSEYAPDLKHSIRNTVLNSRCILMSLFVSSWWVCLFLCFSFRARKYLALNTFYNAAVGRFWKTFKKFAGERFWWRSFLAKFQFFKMHWATGVFLSVFWAPFFIVASKHSTEMHPFDR